jgi:hypothetical protein
MLRSAACEAQIRGAKVSRLHGRLVVAGEGVVHSLTATGADAWLHAELPVEAMMTDGRGGAGRRRTAL